MIVLHGFGSGLGMYDPSPFVLKVACYMRLADIDFTAKNGINNLGKSPKKKLPFITDDTKTIADSSFIINYLEEHYAPDFDAHLSIQQRATATLIGKSLDEHFYWCLVYSRWVDEPTWQVVKQAMFSSMPFPLRIIVPYFARKSVLNQINNQGLGRHSREEVLSLAKETLDALSVLLSDNDFIFGDQPCSLDATIYGFLGEVILCDLDGEINKLGRQYSNLVAYCNRIQARCFATN